MENFISILMEKGEGDQSSSRTEVPTPVRFRIRQLDLSRVSLRCPMPPTPAAQIVGFQGQNHLEYGFRGLKLYYLGTRTLWVHLNSKDLQKLVSEPYLRPETLNLQL